MELASLNDRKLVLLIRYVPTLIVALFATVIMLVFISDSKEKARLSVESLRSNMLDHQKQVIFEQVEQVYNRVVYRQAQTVSELKSQAKQRVDEAHQIAVSIFQNNPNKNKSEIKKMISDALKPIRFYNNRGYFFIFQMDGINVMHALKPQIEGNSAWNAVDIKGTYILREHIKLIQQNDGEAFYRWWYQKPGFPATQEFEKIGFGKAFEPYDWFIGTGEYVADVEGDVKSALITSIADYQSNQEEKVFIFDADGVILVHENSDLVGKNVYQLDGQLAKAWQKLTRRDFAQGDFIEPPIEQVSANSKIAYLRQFNPWGWYIGASFPINEVNRYIEKQQEILEDSHNQQLINLVLISLASTLLMVGLSFVASHIIVKRFGKFQQRITDDFERLEESKNQMQYMALHDPLTGLSNRSALIEQIETGIEQSKDSQKKLAVIFLDLDDFKKVNDLYGHSVGDKLLECLSRKFESLLEPQDSVARFGGDEFIFCFPALDDKQHAIAKTSAVKSVFDEPLIIDGRLLTADCSIGVSMYPCDSDSAETLITNADMVLYRSKQNKKGSILFFDHEINQQIKDEYQIEQQLKHALRRQELSVVYQPQICTARGETVGVEALVRWNSKKHGFVPPDVFIPLAEENGMINEIGLFVFRKACEDICHLPGNGGEGLNVSINVSPKQLLLDGFVESLLAITEEVGITTKRIMLEVTESIFIHDLERVTPIIARLQSHGFSISLDDFGTGYSCLSHLNQFTIDELKIDKSFIANLTDNAQSNALIKAILAIGETYQIKVVAEGVETKEQHMMLSSYGCNCVQGYYFSKPIPVEALNVWLQEREQA